MYTNYERDELWHVVKIILSGLVSKSAANFRKKTTFFSLGVDRKMVGK